MPDSAMKYRVIAVLGATAGIGRDLALKLHDLPEKPTIIAVGRRQERLDELAKSSSDGRIKTRQFDMSQQPALLKQWAQDLVQDFPDLDAIFFVAGIQHTADLNQEVDLEEAQREFYTNFFAVASLIGFFIPHLKELAKDRPVMVSTVSSGLAYVPSQGVPWYSASKAALKSYTLSLRQTLSSVHNFKVVEIAPPLVESELHNHQGTSEKLAKFWMPLSEFTPQVIEGLQQGKDEIPVGQTAKSHEMRYSEVKAEVAKRAEARAAGRR